MKKILKISQKSNYGISAKALGCTSNSGFCTTEINKMPIKQANVKKSTKK